MKNKTKGFLIPLLAIIIAVLAAGGVYYYTTQLPHTSAPEANNQTATTSENSTNKNNPTFSSAALGLELSYPAGYCATERNQAGTEIVVVTDHPNCALLTSFLGMSGVSISASYPGPGMMPLSTWEQTYNALIKTSGGKMLEDTHVKLSGEDAVRFLVDFTAQGGGKMYMVLAIHNGKNYIVSANPYDSGPVGSILSSVKFTQK